MSPVPVTSPYVGLRPFGEAERAFFFGRERDIRVISANIIEEPLTVVYGPSGAGKSSALQAGVLPKLKLLTNAAAVYFRNWQGDNFHDELKARIMEALSPEAPSPEVPAQGGFALGGEVASPGSPAATTDSIQDLLLHAKRQVFLLLDQFEEYLLYHPDGVARDSFDSILARIVNREDIPTRVLIGLREDALSRLNQRFAIRIPDLLGNTLEVKRLSLEAARSAIQDPLKVFSQTPAAEGRGFGIEEKLVEEILTQVREGAGIAGDYAGKGTRTDAKAQIETAYLQLVLTKLWKVERKQDSTLLRLETFHQMGGANEIVRDHVNAVMNGLESDRQRDIAARLFVYLVTPSGTKIAQRTEDLVTFGEAQEAEVKKVLSKLAEQQETRILRPLSNPEQYEIFHDVLARHILAWRRGYEEQKRLAEQKRQQEIEADRKQHELEQAQALAQLEASRAKEQALRADAEASRAREQEFAAKRLRGMVAVLIMLAMLAAAAAIWGAVEQKRAKKNEADAKASAGLADSAKKEAEAATFRLQAEQAEKDKNQAAAQEFKDKAAKLQQQADDAKQQAQKQGTEAVSIAQQLKQAQSQAQSERDKYAQDLKAVIEDRDRQVADLRTQLADLRKKYEPTNSDSKGGPKVDQTQQGPGKSSVFDSKEVIFTRRRTQKGILGKEDQNYVCIEFQILNKSAFPVTFVKVLSDVPRGRLQWTSINPSDSGNVLINPGTSFTFVSCAALSLLKSAGIADPTTVVGSGRFRAAMSGPNGEFELISNPPSSFK